MSEPVATPSSPGSPTPPASGSVDRSPLGPQRPPPKIPDHELLHPIGRGAYGEVWLARSVMGTLRAVKVVFRQDFGEPQPFEREFKGIQKFEPVSRSHDGLIDILQIGRNDADGYFYYIMELADDASERSDGVVESWSDGKPGSPEPSAHRSQTSSLEAFNSGSAHDSTTPKLHDPNSYVPHTLRHDLRTRGRLPIEECLKLGLALTSALEHLHQNGLVHRDVKPSNIIFVDGQPKLADIGLVAGVDDARSFVGTEGYIPPEGPGKPQADLYSLGIVLYVMSKGKRHDAFPEPLADLASDPDHRRWLELNAIIHRACHADPRGRYQTAGEIHADLDLLRQGQSVRRRQWLAASWRRVRMAGTAVAAVALAVLALREWTVRSARQGWSGRRCLCCLSGTRRPSPNTPSSTKPSKPFASVAGSQTRSSTLCR